MFPLQLVGRVQGRRTTGGQGAGKADKWRAGPREGEQLAGKVQGRRTTGGQGPGKADGQGQGKADNWRAGSRVKVCFRCFLLCLRKNTINCTFYSAVEFFLQKWPFGMFFGPRRFFRFWSKTPETDWDDTPGLPRRVIPVRFQCFF